MSHVDSFDFERRWGSQVEGVTTFHAFVLVEDTVIQCCSGFAAHGATNTAADNPADQGTSQATEQRAKWSSNQSDRGTRLGPAHGRGDPSGSTGYAADSCSRFATNTTEVKMRGFATRTDLHEELL
jgi:hypothetical protein